MSLIIIYLGTVLVRIEITRVEMVVHALLLVERLL